MHMPINTYGPFDCMAYKRLRIYPGRFHLLSDSNAFCILNRINLKISSLLKLNWLPLTFEVLHRLVLTSWLSKKGHCSMWTYAYMHPYSYIYTVRVKSTSSYCIQFNALTMQGVVSRILTCRSSNIENITQCSSGLQMPAYNGKIGTGKLWNQQLFPGYMNMNWDCLVIRYFTVQS